MKSGAALEKFLEPFWAPAAPSKGVMKLFFSIFRNIKCNQKTIIFFSIPFIQSVILKNRTFHEFGAQTSFCVEAPEYYNIFLTLRDQELHTLWIQPSWKKDADLFTEKKYMSLQRP